MSNISGITSSGNIDITSSETRNAYHIEVSQPKKSRGMVLVVAAHGTREFMQDVRLSLKLLDTYLDDYNDGDNSIVVQDIHGCDALRPDYELSEDIGDEPQAT